ncbi:ArpU family phage packaging/lysis transcriptional regulator [Mechercharimyces sp. CAU 1602]|uniref:ArpU family phage packaging/lysis transcriptional regulator n=1 Tax=Mechercharimyces sp. CAU 1602 TaxID=2973933 RepID=UPI0021637B53|nr:ArpU family phage packaging/lysis transcriptional regulator [Mechercharimyces sp. CAU 1602]MCS1351168.1 hypothetical protein [Mechercharimyces sp. CAU 1602]
MESVAAGTKAANKKPVHRRKVEELLKNYRTWKATLQMEEEFPSCTPVYEERTSPGYSAYVSTTEQYGIRRTEQRERLEWMEVEVKRIERSLAVLDIDERLVLEERYMQNRLDKEVQARLMWSESTYRRIKKEAMRKMAVMLGVV